MSTYTRHDGSCEVIVTDMRKKFHRGEMTDVTVRYGEDGKFSKKAHRLVLCAASKFFDNMLHKHDFKEKKEGVVNWAVQDKEVAEVVLDCIYGADYIDTGRRDPALFFNIHVYAAADYSDLESIRFLAANKFEKVVSRSLDAKGGCAVFISAMKLAYEETQIDDKILRPLIAELCVKNKGLLFAQPGFRSALRVNAELGADISFAFAKAPSYDFVSPSGSESE